VSPRLTEVFNVEEARSELREKSHKDIERETADKWAGRAAAAYQLAEETGDTDWLRRADDFRHEALEHAAMSEDFDFLAELKGKIDGFRSDE
jgi:hypothetical protein